MDNPWIISLYGWILFNVIMWSIVKDETDGKRKPFNYKLYWRYHNDNIIASLVSIPLLVMGGESLWQLVVNDLAGKDWVYNEISLIGSVPFVQWVVYLYKKYKSK